MSVVDNQVKHSIAVVSAGRPTLPAPIDCRAPLLMTGAKGEILEQISLSELPLCSRQLDEPGTPVLFAVVGNLFRFCPIADRDFALELAYEARPVPEGMSDPVWSSATGNPQGEAP